MVKIHCDRCGKEIKDKYYTINMNEYDVNPKYNYNATGYASACSNSQRESILVTLNNTKMYCKDCRDDIEYFINNRESKEDTELRELSHYEDMSE